MVRRRLEQASAPRGGLSLTAKGVLVVAIPVAALLGAMVVFYLVQRQTNEAQGWVEHTFQVRALIRDAMLHLANAESGLRGYLLTRRDRDLVVYQSARQQLPESIHILEKSVADNPSQVQKLARVRDLLAEVEQSMDSQNQAAAEPAQVGAQLESNRASLRQLRTELSSMQDVEDQLLLQRTEARRAAESRLEATMLAGGIFGLLGGVIAMLVFTNGISRRVQLVEEDAKRVAEGVPVASNVSGNDAIGRLAGTLKETADLVTHQKEDLLAARAEMEQRVEERTAQLAAAIEDLRHSNQVREAVVQSSPLAIWALDRDGNVVFWNPAAERIFGWAEAEVIGKPLPIIPEELMEEHQQWLELYRRGESLAAVERPRVRKDKTRIEVSIWTAPQRDANGRINGSIAINSDVSQRKVLEEQFRQSQKLEAVGRLAGGVAHDFNNLLTVIMGYVEMLLLEASDRPELTEYAQEVQYAAGRASALTAQLLAFSRRQISQPKVLNLNDLVTHSMKLLRRVISENIELTTHLDPALGQVKADPIHIDQVIMNLVVNARDAMPQGGRLSIDTANVMLDEDYAGRHLGVKAGPYVMLAISDNGTGMTDETKSRLFEPFFTTKEAGKGTGLGLSIVYGIVKQNCGEILVYSELGRGTTFKLYFPAVAMPAELAASEQRGHSMRGTETVLVCEDEAGIRKLVVAMLTKQGYKVLEAERPQDAIVLLRDHLATIDLLLTDIVMPHINGFELAGTARELRPQIRILYMSGYTDSQVGASWPINEDTPFLHKPFSASTLANKVREVLSTPATA